MKTGAMPGDARPATGFGVPPSLPEPPAGNRHAVVLMTASMAAFAVEDALVKTLTVTLAPGQVVMTVGALGMAVFWLLLARQGGRLWTRDLLLRPVLLRNLGEVVGSTGFIMALALTELSSASAILQALPLALVMGGALFLGERVGWRRWSAILVGFAGVLLIIRPGTGGFEPRSVLALIGVAGLALRDLATRRMPRHILSHQLSASAFATLIPGGLALALLLGEPLRLPTLVEAAGFAACITVGVAGYAMMIVATRVGEASLVAPLRYTRLVFALIVAVLVFGERPDALTLAGAALIVGSGGFAMWRELRLARRG
ncbi:DMT family transporter [Paracoccus alkenifer]|uniref:Permease of the drug/metabolite transporter (DMT) superfamily n=1 Tax=Paracoccus alkenifer TaxID=65735 RepID=A0A1H6LH84_9RHOB|nr:DMT family transporter [Paracoccus alkenifer]SEH87881.1 Permease of the drug/metabolite transporter (DMT) superfamily [Paracoccus alkenifer]